MKSKSLILSVVVALAGFLPQSQAALYDSFAVLAGSTVTSTGTGSTVLNGDLGAGTSTSGFLGTVSGTTYTGGSDAFNNAHDAAVAKYDILAGLPGASDLTSQGDLGVGVLTLLLPGVYKFDTTALLAGTLTLSGTGDFVFQIGSTLGTDSGSSVVLTGGAQAGNVYWQVGSAATLGANTTFNGSIFANTSITMGNRASMTGIAFANTTVTLDENFITAVPEAAAFWPLVFCASVFGAWQCLAVWRRNPESFRG